MPVLKKLYFKLQLMKGKRDTRFCDSTLKNLLYLLLCMFMPWNPNKNGRSFVQAG